MEENICTYSESCMLSGIGACPDTCAADELAKKMEKKMYESIKGGIG
jgi:hypothetical protein